MKNLSKVEKTRKKVKARINLLFQRYCNLGLQQTQNTWDVEEGKIKYSQRDKMNEKLQRREYKALETLEDYMEEKNLYSEDRFEGILTKKSLVMWADCCSRFHELFDRDIEYIEEEEVEEVAEEVAEEVVSTFTITIKMHETGEETFATLSIEEVEAFEEYTAEEIEIILLDKMPMAKWSWDTGKWELKNCCTLTLCRRDKERKEDSVHFTNNPNK